MLCELDPLMNTLLAQLLGILQTGFVLAPLGITSVTSTLLKVVPLSTTIHP